MAFKSILRDYFNYNNFIFIYNIFIYLFIADVLVFCRFVSVSLPHGRCAFTGFGGFLHLRVSA